MESRFEKLREKAELMLRDDPGVVPRRGSAELRHLMHELSVYQAELEIQNEELRAAQQESDRVSRRFHALFDRAPVGYVALTADGKVSEANQTALVSITGGRNQLVGKAFSDFLHRDDRAEFGRFLTEAWTSDDRVIGRTRAISPTTGGEMWFQVEAQRHSTVSENLMCLTISDVTDLVTTQQQLMDLTQTLEIRVEEKTKEATYRARQLQALTHEVTQVRNAERRRLSQQLHDYLAQILTAVRLKTHVARVQIGNSPEAEELREVEELIADATSYVRTLMADLSPSQLNDAGLVQAIRHAADVMEKHGLRVHITESGTTFLPHESREFAYEAVRELLNNSMKYACTGEAFVDVAQRGSWVEVVVRDAGVGAELDAIRSADPLQEKFGLFSIRERAEALHCQFSVESAPGKGMKCTLRIPQSMPSAGGKVEEVGSAAIRLLIVDDHAAMRQGLAGVFAGLDDVFVVGEADCGQGAIALARSLHPNAILMDVNMRDMSGVQATRVLKQELPDVAVVGLSMRDDESIRLEMREAGAFSHLSKEASIEEIVGELRKAVGAG